jgi:hypothetical protein
MRSSSGSTGTLSKASRQQAPQVKQSKGGTQAPAWLGWLARYPSLALESPLSDIRFPLAFALLVSIAGVVVVGRVLLTRADPPLRGLLALGWLVVLASFLWALSTGQSLLVLAQAQLIGGMLCGWSWAFVVMCTAPAVFLQPGAPGEPRPALRPLGRRQAMELLPLLPSLPFQLMCCPNPLLMASLGLVLLGWRGGARPLRIRAQLAVLVAAAVIIVALSLFSFGRLWPLLIGLLLLPLLGLPWSAWREAGVPWRSLGGLAPLLVVWAVSAALLAERYSRIARAAWAVGAPVLSFVPMPAGLLHDSLETSLPCLASPSRPCPPGRPARFAWPADAPLGPVLMAHQAIAQVVAQTWEGPVTVTVHYLPHASPQGLFVSRREGQYVLAGKPWPATGLSEGLRAADAACRLGSWTMLDPEVDWTAQEIVDLCVQRSCIVAREGAPCAWGEPSPDARAP